MVKFKEFVNLFQTYYNTSNDIYIYYEENKFYTISVYYDKLVEDFNHMNFEELVDFPRFRDYIYALDVMYVDDIRDSGIYISIGIKNRICNSRELVDVYRKLSNKK